jgi:hypothetical protein
MALSDAEIENIRESETLKDEIRKLLQPAQPESRLSDFAKQLLLLIIGFALTAGVGGGLTYYWKARELKNQRSYLEERHALDKASAIIDKTAKEVATTVVAADDVLATYYPNEWTQEEISERRKNWVATSRNWRTNAQLLSVDIASTFSSADINQLFLQIMQKRTKLGNIITNLPRTKSEIAADKTLKQELDDGNALKLEIIDLLHKCSDDMTSLARQGAIQ